MCAIDLSVSIFLICPVHCIRSCIQIISGWQEAGPASSLICNYEIHMDPHTNKQFLSYSICEVYMQGATFTQKAWVQNSLWCTIQNIFCPQFYFLLFILHLCILNTIDEYIKRKIANYNNYYRQDLIHESQEYNPSTLPLFHHCTMNMLTIFNMK